MFHASKPVPSHTCILEPQDGLESKNNRTRVACAEELACLFKKEGAAVYRANKVKHCRQVLLFVDDVTHHVSCSAAILVSRLLRVVTCWARCRMSITRN